MHKNRNLNPYVDGIYYGRRNIYVIVSCVLIISMLSVIFDFRGQHGIDTWGCTEFLINYQGGFVRRGLVGEILFHTCTTLHVSPVWFIYSVSILSFLYVWAFFLKKFRDEGYSWWYLCSPLVLGFTLCVIRKDFLEYSLLIAIVTLLRQPSSSLTRRLMATSVAVFAVFVHEAFIFWGGSVFALIMLGGDGKRKAVNYIMISGVVLAFVLQSYYKGDPSVAETIQKSWNPVIGSGTLGDAPSIDAIGWETLQTVLFHMECNFFNGTSGQGLIWQPVWAVAIYYFCTNFPFAFCRSDIADKSSAKLAFSSVYLFTLICLLPMFLALSCDYARIYQYASVSALALMVSLPSGRILGLLPRCFMRSVSRLNVMLEKMLPPSCRIMVILLLFLGMSPSGFSIYHSVEYSVVGKVIAMSTGILCVLVKKMIVLID